jgi:hypothetical protein
VPLTWVSEARHACHRIERRVLRSECSPRGSWIALVHAKIPSALFLPFVLCSRPRRSRCPEGMPPARPRFPFCCADMSHLTTLAGGGHLRSALLLRCRGAQKTKEKPRLLSLSSSYERASSGPCTRPDSCRANSTHPLDPTSPTPWLASRLNAGFPSPSSPTGARASSRSRRSSRQGRCHSDPLLECRHAVRSALRLPE